MLYKTRGIVLHQINYSESSIIARIYTEQLGLQSYIIKGARSRKSAVKAKTIQPLALLEMIVYKKEKSALQTIKELRNTYPQSSIAFDVHKSSIALFINEILYKCIREEEPDSSLFEFIHNSIHILDLKTANYANFHLLFLIKLSKYLGFSPRDNYTIQNNYFDLREGSFKNGPPAHNYFISFPLSEYLHRLISLNFDSIDELKISTRERRELLQKLIEYYELHIARLSDIKSHHVLESVIG